MKLINNTSEELAWFGAFIALLGTLVAVTVEPTAAFTAGGAGLGFWLSGAWVGLKEGTLFR